MTTCNRCGRALTNPKSIERKYGPVCWKKVQKEDKEIAYDKGEKEVNDYPKLFEHLDALDIPICISCGASLLFYGRAEHYKHPAGYKIRGYKDPQWIFLECMKCDYQNSLQKLLRFHKPKDPCII